MLATIEVATFAKVGGRFIPIRQLEGPVAIRLAFAPVPMNDLVRVERTGTSDPDVRVLVGKSELLRALLAGADEFFEVYGKVGDPDLGAEVRTSIGGLQSRLGN